LKYIRITPRKFRLIIPLVKGRNPEEAIAILMATKKGASKYAIELLKSAIANAKRKQQGVDISTLYISRMVADCGPTLKRFRAASMGRASMIKKRTSHLTVELDQKAVVEKQKADSRKPKAKEAPKAEKNTAAPKKHKTKEHTKPETVKKGKE